MLFTENKSKKALISSEEQGSQKKRDKKKGKKGAKALADGISSWATSVNSDGVVPAWSDASVDKLQVNIEDRSRLRKLKKEEGETLVTGDIYMKRLQDHYNTTSGAADLFAWAKPQPPKPSHHSENIDEEDPITQLLKSNTSVFSSHTTGLLKPGQRLDYTKLQHANNGSYHASVVTAVEFHPSEEGLLATAGLDRKVQLYSVARERESQKVQTIVLPDLPVYQAKFIGDGSQMIISGNRKYFYYYDLEANKLEKVHGVHGGAFSNTGDALTSLTRLFTPPSPQADLFAFADGDSGSISVLSQKTKKMAFELKLSSSSCTSVGFSGGPDPRLLYAVGDQAEIYVWDIRHSRKCLSKVQDEGCFNTTHLTVSADGSQLATGSHSGVVNVYKTETEGKPLTLVKSILNLTTAITDLKFDPTGQLLAVCSKWKKNALRLIHTGPGGTFTTYQNFPAGHAVGVLKYPLCMGFSSDSQYFAMGNDEGKAHLWHLSHFSGRVNSD
ncbi:hypothetical protein FGO68_gene12597 [Halteria grandinella]|uniref:Uncharacterized protein n=1 Tax=Halteria grandinella TaxID=5974 RepID=A0A8J8NEQ6_HALGN|nr:hypothetical protein FGO68_gene12597 [Halteria grandinella]